MYYTDDEYNPRDIREKIVKDIGSELVFTNKKWYNKRMRYTSDMSDKQWEMIRPL